MEKAAGSEGNGGGEGGEGGERCGGEGREQGEQRQGGGRGFGGEVGQISICGLSAVGENFTLSFSIWIPEIFHFPASYS